MAIALDSLRCHLAVGGQAASLSAPTADRPAPPQLAVVSEGSEVVWHFANLSLDAPPKQHSAGRLTFAIGSDSLLQQRAQFPTPQSSPSESYALNTATRGRERWARRSRPVKGPIASFRLTRAFIACPEPAALVADTTATPSLHLRWSGTAADADQQIEFSTDLEWDAAPDRRWREPTLELRMTHATYANLMAALHSIG